MDRDIGRGRHGRETSKAHASVRLKGTAPAPKRGCGRQGPQLVQGTHDGEAGVSVGSRSRGRKRELILHHTPQFYYYLETPELLTKKKKAHEPPKISFILTT
ncbi:hypothetical protein QL285_069524 [Trifolium repens]|nr:hypothetical protein QL285_069524 [Trifolium repens]